MWCIIRDQLCEHSMAFSRHIMVNMVGLDKSCREGNREL